MFHTVGAEPLFIPTRWDAHSSILLASASEDDLHAIDRRVAQALAPWARDAAQRDRADVHGLGLPIDAYGPEYTPVDHKIDALRSYRFHVAIENVNTGLWFTEALIDPLLTFTMPIYWGSLDAIEHWGFDAGGILWVPDEDHLVELSRDLSDPKEAHRVYNNALPALRRNFVKAHDYTCPEDWLWRQNPELFGGRQ